MLSAASSVPAPPPAWLDREAYPFAPHYATLPAGRMHYVDEGQGEPVVFVHGTPAWSFLYRAQIKALAGRYRCIAPDHLGFGLSDKPPHWDYHPARQAENLERLLDGLDLRIITLVVHDVGGPIGLAYALKHPERIRRLVILNTWLWPVDQEPAAKKIDGLLHSWLGKFLYLSLNLSPKVLLKKAFADAQKLAPAVHRQYTAPFPNRDSRWGLLQTGRWLTRASSWYAEQARSLPRLAGKPVLLLWGTKDPFFGEPYLARWQQLLPVATTKRLPVGHFLQEEDPQAITAALEAFLQGQR